MKKLKEFLTIALMFLMIGAIFQSCSEDSNEDVCTRNADCKAVGNMCNTKSGKCVAMGTDYVTINKVDDLYYNVVLNFKDGISHFDMGAMYMAKIDIASPDFQKDVNDYLMQAVYSAVPDLTSPTANEQAQVIYNMFLARMRKLYSKLDQEYKDELDGMASVLTTDENNMHDDKLSRDELLTMDLLVDVLRPTACSVLSVYGDMSATGNNIVGRVTDFPAGQNGELQKIHAVTTIKNGDKSFMLLGFLGGLSVVTAYDKDQIFAAILDADSYQQYSADGDKVSYSFALRHAIENYSTKEEISKYMKTKTFTFNHQVFLADANDAAVLEDINFDTPENTKRELRVSTSVLNDGIVWDFKNALAAVNTYMLKGNMDKYTNNPYNKARFDNIYKLLKAKSDVDKITSDDVKEIMTHYENGAPDNKVEGDIYNLTTLEIMVVEPSENKIKMFFQKPLEHELNPQFKEIAVNFE